MSTSIFHMEIPVYREDRCITTSVPNQDYTVAMVIRGGPMVSRLDVTTYHKVFDMMGPDGSLMFYMTVLDYSKLSSKYPEFTGSGLSGWWKIHRTDLLDSFKRGPRISLSESVPVASRDDLETLVLHTSSAHFVRERYAKLLEMPSALD